MKIRCINDDDYLSIVKGHVYEAKKIADHFYAIVDEDGEEWGYPAALFEVVPGGEEES